MTIKLTATQVKAHILRLLDQVAAGEEIEITRHGRSIARLVPINNPRSLKGSCAGIAMSATQDDEDLFSTGAPWNLP